MFVHLRPFTAEAPGKGEILGLTRERVPTMSKDIHDVEEYKHIHGDTLSVNSGQVSVLEKGDEVSLGSFLESHHSGRLEAEIGLNTEQKESIERSVSQNKTTNLEILSNLTDKPLEGKLADEELS